MLVRLGNIGHASPEATPHELIQPKNANNVKSDDRRGLRTNHAPKDMIVDGTLIRLVSWKPKHSRANTTSVLFDLS